MLLELSGNLRLIIAIVISTLISVFLYKPLYIIASKKGLFKAINGRSCHNGNVPDFGGVILFASIFITFLALVHFPNPEMQYVLIAMTAIWAVGLYDDVLVLSPKKKFYAEVISSLVVIVGGGLYFTNFHGIFGIYEIPFYIGIIFTLVMMIGIINAINMIDGIDGLCSGISILILSSFSLWFYKNEYFNYSIFGFSTVAALVPLFIRNVFGTKTKLFLGDSGSMLLGLIISVLSIKFCELEITTAKWMNISNSPAVAFTFLAIPVLDTIRIMVVRLYQKKSPFFPDKSHIHHRLLTIFNNSHKKSTFILLMLQLSFIIMAVFCTKLTNEALILTTAMSFTVVYGLLYVNAKKIVKNIPFLLDK